MRGVNQVEEEVAAAMFSAYWHDLENRPEFYQLGEEHKLRWRKAQEAAAAVMFKPVPEIGDE